MTAKRWYRHWVVPIVLLALAAIVAFIQSPAPIGPAQSWIDWLRYPVEQNALSRLPKLRDALSEVAIAPDGRHAIAVGDSGTVLVSADGGASWAHQTQVRNSLNSVAIASDGRHAIAVGDNGTVLVSADTGASWVSQTQGNKSLRSVSIAPDGRHAIAVGDSGTVLVSADGGASWARQTQGSDFLKSVAIAPDGRRAVVVGFSGTVLVSADGGVSWARQTQASDSLFSVAFGSDGRRAIAVGVNGAVLVSADGGASWARRTQGSDIFESVSIAPDGRRAIAVGSGGTVLVSADGGASWARQTQGSDNLFSVAFGSDGRRAIAVGYNGTVLVSTDGGATWGRQTQVRISLKSVAIASDGRRAIAVGDKGAALVSADGGASWVRRTQGSDDLLSVAIASDGRRAIAVGDYGTVLTSADGGASWTRQTQGRNSLYSVSIASDGRRAIVVGNKGTVLVSADGGASWARQPRGSDDLFSVAIASDGRRAIAVGREGTVLISADGGASWARQTQGSDNLFSVAVASDGRRAIAVGDYGTVLISADGGASWGRQTPDSAMFMSVAIASDGRRAIAAGSSGEVLVSSDGGVSWARQPQRSKFIGFVMIAADGRRAVAVGDYGEVLVSADGAASWARLAHPAPHRQYPAPWFYVAVLACAAWLWWAMRSPAAVPDDGATAMAASDAPAATFRDDRLEFTPLARGISRFLRHDRTQPPLSLAITGEWGRGKSTLMNLVCEDLERCGWRAVWFNAWHHQTEEQMLPALLDAIRRRGLPRGLSLAGIRFRLQLLWLRSKPHFLASVVLALVASAAIGFLWAHHDSEQIRQLTEWIKSQGRMGTDPLTVARQSLWYGPIAAWFGLGMVVVPLLRGLRPFGLDPAVLLAGTLNKVRLREMSAQTSFRTRFAREFGEVAKALPDPIVIVIDDLDRCQPAAVLQIMEAVNFLTNAGDCYVIFGMASDRVLASLALSFKDIAGELAEFDLPTGVDRAPAAADEKGARERRQRYARDYLQKLINIEIVVPDRPELTTCQLLRDLSLEAADRRSRIRSFEHWIMHRAIPATMAASLLLAIFGAGLWGAGSKVTTPAQNVGAPAPEVAPTPGLTGAKSPEPEPSPVLEEGLGESGYENGEPGGISFWWVAGLIALFGGIVAGTLVRNLMKEDKVVRDSEAFRRARDNWLPVAAFANDSPRAIKRFGNRIRYLCMLQQGERMDDRSRLERLADVAGLLISLVWRVRQGKKSPDPVSAYEDSETGAGRALNEHRVVALSAMQTVRPGDWRSVVEQFRGRRSTSSPIRGELDERILKAVSAYRKATGAGWPPSRDELDAFERTLRGVRLPGDPLLAISRPAVRGKSIEPG